MNTTNILSTSVDKQKSFFQFYFTPSAWWFFVVICLVEAYVKQGLYSTPKVSHNSIKDSHSKEEINNQLLLHSKTEWLTYILIPVFILFQALMASFCLNIR